LRSLAIYGPARTGRNKSYADYASDDNAGVEDYHDRHPIILAQAPTSVDVFPVGGGLDSLSIAKIRAFAERYRELGSGQITILAPAGRLDRSFHLPREQSPDLTRDFQKWPFPLLDTDPSIFESNHNSNDL
jgi:hypothetical protein